MTNHVKKFYSAVSVLTGHGHIKQRLIKAFEDNLAHIEHDNLPGDLRESFGELSHLMTQVEPLNGEGPICASVRKMSIDEADQCAQRILDLYRNMLQGAADKHTAIPLQVEDRQVTTPVLVNTN
ncbi:MAG: hypothetical protein R3192_10100 [Woeseiaceae bacterium]|nr:hypothetical protein [Woeseiaceae bacterium]